MILRAMISYLKAVFDFDSSPANVNFPLYYLTVKKTFGGHSPLQTGPCRQLLMSFPPHGAVIVFH